MVCNPEKYEITAEQQLELIREREEIRAENPGERGWQDHLLCDFTEDF